MIQRRTLTEEVSERLRQEILSGKFEPGERLVVQTLATRYGVSHIPVREALRILEAESLVSNRRGSSAVVAEVSLEDLQDLYSLRRLIEEQTLRRAVAKYTDEVLDEAAEQLERLQQAEPSHSDSVWWAAHRDFHWSLLRPGITPWTERVLRLIWQSVERYQRLYTLLFGDVTIANAEHQRFLDVARSGDAEELVRCWIEHLDEKQTRVAEGFRNRHR